MVVDDSSLTRKQIMRIIGMVKNIKVENFFEAGNGLEALKILDSESENVDLVLADLNMPEMGGAEMVHRIKTAEATKSIPVVVVSTESRTTRLKSLLAEGVKDYLHKPFTPEEFKEVLQGVWNETEVEINSALNDALGQALETMAYLTILVMEDELDKPEKTITAEISFTGTKEGTIQIMAGWNFGKILAENISCLTNVDDESAFEALKELSNVTCGLFLPMVVSSTADTFDITVPRVKICEDASQWNEFVEHPDSCVLNIEGFPVVTRVILKEQE